MAQVPPMPDKEWPINDDSVLLVYHNLNHFITPRVWYSLTRPTHTPKQPVLYLFYMPSRKNRNNARTSAPVSADHTPVLFQFDSPSASPSPAAALPVVELPATVEHDLIDNSSPVPNTSLPLQPAETSPYRIISLDLRDDEPQLVDARFRPSEVYEHPPAAQAVGHVRSPVLTR
jgi:hypothetical protein